MTLPLLPTMGVGSYAAPGWLIGARGPMRDGAFGPADVDELFEDATRIAIADQLEAGLDVITDGELHRSRFVYEMFGHLSGLERVSARRKLGIGGYDQAPHFKVTGPITAPRGLGVVAEFKALQRLAPGRPLKVALPGPITFADPLIAGERGAAAILDELVTIVRAEISALVAAGAEFVQLDEPGWSHPPLGLSHADGVAVINRTLAGFKVRRAVHVCFGNNAGRPIADRRMAHLISPMSDLDCEQLVLEFANREMADIERMAELSSRFEIAAGVVDVKNFHLEDAEQVDERIHRCLAHIPRDKLWLTADCGFSALPRSLARAKVQALVAGARLARTRL